MIHRKLLNAAVLLLLASAPLLSQGEYRFDFPGTVTQGALGSGVGAAGDVDNDGYPDMVVGSPGDGFNGFFSGSARVQVREDAHCTRGKPGNHLQRGRIIEPNIFV